MSRRDRKPWIKGEVRGSGFKLYHYRNSSSTWREQHVKAKRIVLQDLASRRYLTTNRTWVNSCLEGMTFEHVCQAVVEAVKHAETRFPSRGALIVEETD